jgi:excisionase family DNA binding protein
LSVNENRPTIMTVSELANYLRLHEQTVYKMAKEGRVPAYKVGNRWRFRKGVIDEWLLTQRSDSTEMEPALKGGEQR